MNVLSALFLACVIAALAPRPRRWPYAAIVAGVAVALTLALLDRRPGVTVFTMTGTPSITTFALLIDRALRRAGGPAALKARERTILLSFLAVASICVYPAALGLVTFVDVYRLGFLAGAPVVLALIGAAFAWRRDYGIVAIALVALVALDTHLLLSVNVFDYVIDPLGGGGALLWAVVRGFRALIGRVRRRSQPADAAWLAADGARVA